MKIGNIVIPKEIIMEAKIQGYIPGETSIGENARTISLNKSILDEGIGKLPLDLPATTDGKMIKCKYYLEFLTEV
jgi:hypothetical protein